METWVLITLIVGAGLAVLAMVVGCLCCCKRKKGCLCCRCCQRKKGHANDVESQRKTSSNCKTKRRGKSTHIPGVTRSTRFKKQPGLDKTSGHGTLDLHGCTQSGAMSRLKTFLHKSITGYRKSNHDDNKRSVQVITGRGLHSAGGVPVIKPAVKKYLKDQNYTHEWSNPGMVTIDLGK